jgi:hypothetical protein
MTKLPIIEQRMIFSTGLFSKLLLDTLQILPESERTFLTQKLVEHVNVEVSRLSDAEITQTLKDYLKKHEELVNKHNGFVLFQEDNN